MIKKVLDEPTISFLGNKGRGKSVGAAILVNNMQNDVVIIDTVGAFTNKKLIKRAIYLDVDVRKFSKEMVMKIFRKFETTQRIVLNTQKLTRKELVEFVDCVSAVAMEVGDVGFVLDEAGEVVSQQREFYSSEYERLVRVGRNYEVRPVIQITQRPQKVDKNVLALTDYWIILGLSHNLDLNQVKDMIGYDDGEFKEVRKEIKSQRIGDVLLVKYDGTLERAMFKMNTDTLELRTNARRQKKVIEEYNTVEE